jgi:hypothetical protein
MKFRWLIPIPLIVIILFLVLRHPPRAEVNRSFYYWKQDFRLDSYDIRMLATLGIRTMYVRMMDVDHRELNGAVPVSTVDFWNYLPDSMRMIPAVYITNRTFEKISMKDSRELADKVYRKILDLAAWQSSKISEIQIDCDWNSSTREKYFTFLQRLDSITETPLSATIRLHQVKYQKKTGIPPVQKGLLMFYNMSPVAQDTSLSSIIDIDEAKKYVSSSTRYPLNLDVGLPVFCWAKAFRGGKLLGIVNGIGEEEMRKITFFRKETGHKYRCTADTVYANIYFRKGDVMRIEEPTAEQLQQAAELTSSFIGNDKLNVAFYHWDSTLIKKYGHETLTDIYDRYR